MSAAKRVCNYSAKSPRSPYRRRLNFVAAQAFTDKQLADIYQLKPCVVRIRPLDEKTLKKYTERASLKRHSLSTLAEKQTSTSDLARVRRALIEEFDKKQQKLKQETRCSSDESISPVKSTAAASSYRYAMSGRVSAEEPQPSQSESRCIVS